MSPKVEEPQAQFKFPFQRRARSLSLPKDKDGNDIKDTEAQYDSNKPIMAKDNFLVAHKNLVPGVMKLIQ